MADDRETAEAKRKAAEEARAQRELKLQHIHAAQARRASIVAKADRATRRLRADERDRGRKK